MTLRRALIAWGLLGLTPAAAAWAEVSRLLDEQGTVYVTNVPADPRYRAFAGSRPLEATRDGRGTGARSPGRSPAAAVDRATLQELAARHAVDPILVEALVWTESAFDSTAVSPKGAAGLMQLMPATASRLGVADRFDPRLNLDGGIRHLRYLLQRYRGDVAHALAAYNAGEAAVDSFGGIPPYPETERYVRTVLERARLTPDTRARVLPARP